MLTWRGSEASPRCRLYSVPNIFIHDLYMQGKLGSLELSLDDDEFFAVPDMTANHDGRTSLDNANGPLGKGFISEDVRTSASICRGS